MVTEELQRGHLTACRSDPGVGCRRRNQLELLHPLMGILRSFLTGWPGQKPAVQRDVEPLEGTRMSLFNSQIPAWWQANQQGQFDGMFTLGGGVARGAGVGREQVP